MTEKKVIEMQAEHGAWNDAQPLTTRCAFCDWTHEGTVASGRHAAREHREAEHPEAAVRRARGRKRVWVKRQDRGASLNDQIKLEADAARQARAEREDAERLAKVLRGRARDAIEEAA